MRIRNSQRGFSILEVIVAMTVGTLLMLGLSTLVNNILTINDRTRDTVLINSFVEDQVEQLRSASFSNLANGTYDIISEVPSTISTVSDAEYVVKAATDGALATNPAIREINFTIVYADRGVVRNFEYRTYIGELGVGQY